MKKLCLLLLALPFIFGFTGYGGYHEFTWPDGVVAYYNSSPRGKNSDTESWSDLSKSRATSARDLDMTGVSSPAITLGKYRTFAGAEYFNQEEIDNETGALTYTTEGADSTFTDAGQVFTTYGATGTATHRIVVHNDDATITYGYCGAAVSATEIKVYKNISLTTTGWNGTAPAGKTPSTYEVYKVLGTTNLTGDQTHILVVKPDDGQPAAAEMLSTRWLNLGTDVKVYQWYLRTDGILQCEWSADGSTHMGVTTDAAFFTDGAQSNFTNFGIVYDAGTAVTIYKNGAEVDSTANAGIPASLYDGYMPLVLGRRNDGYYLNGQIGLYMVIEAALTAAQAEYIYDHFKADGVH